MSIDREDERLVHIGWETWGTASRVPLPAEARLTARLGELATLLGVGTPTALRVRHGATRVHWSLLLDVPDTAVATALRRMTQAGVIRVEGGSLSIPWEVLPAFLGPVTREQGGHR